MCAIICFAVSLPCCRCRRARLVKMITIIVNNLVAGAKQSLITDFYVRNSSTSIISTEFSAKIIILVIKHTWIGIQDTLVHTQTQTHTQIEAFTLSNTIRRKLRNDFRPFDMLSVCTPLIAKYEWVSLNTSLDSSIDLISLENCFFCCFGLHS